MYDFSDIGKQFAVGWWIWIDAQVITDHEANPLTPNILPWYYIPGILGTLGLVMYVFPFGLVVRFLEIVVDVC